MPLDYRILPPLVAALIALAGPARADCYDVFGCSERNQFRLQDLLAGPNCDFLYEMRNRIYAEHHYCFKTQRAIATLGNEGCLYSDVNQVPLNQIERNNAATILRAEQMKGCPE
ncbi:MAG TPA: YARHG domain-containing protein [Roseiarcus sp.]|nr:YARHG domain-containing protein [Roseiarcus sp.]